MDAHLRDVEVEEEESSDSATERSVLEGVSAHAEENDKGQSSEEDTNVDSGIEKSGASAVHVDSDDETDTVEGSSNEDDILRSFTLFIDGTQPKIKVKLSSPQHRRVDVVNDSMKEGPIDVLPKPPPIRIKLSLKKLPIAGTNVNVSDAAKKVGTASTATKGAVAGVTKTDTATTKVGKTSRKILPTISKAATGTASKRRSLLPPKQVRLPPITSPGLRMLRPPIPIISSDSTEPYYTPQQVFDVTMTAAGYTVEQRTKRPHRGSSVQRTVDDLFDTNVKLALHPLELVPSSLWNHKVLTPSVVSQTSDPGSDDPEYTSLPQLLIRGLEAPKQSSLPERQHQKSEKSASDEGAIRKRRRSYAPMKFRDMVPVSLTIPYPESYIQKRIDYISKVKHREDCIVQWQAAQDEFELSQDVTDKSTTTDSDAGAIGSNSALSNPLKKSRASFVNPVTVPSIPEPPDPPKLKELLAPSSSAYEDNLLETDSRSIPSISPFYYLCPDEDGSNHPIYLPKGKEELVAHLDPKCFHITEGRYFGLQTSMIADPNFVGPSAPGLASGNTSTGGLATATTSTTTSTSGLTGGGMTMILSASFHSAAAVPATHVKDETTNHATATKSNPHHDVLTENSETGRDNFATAPGTPKSDSPLWVASSVDVSPAEKFRMETVKSDKAVASPSTTYDPAGGSAFDLRKIMEGSDETLIEKFREGIVRAVVHAFRTRQPHNASFRAPNGKTYHDIGKAFAIYGGVKTCERCKSNKQGVSSGNDAECGMEYLLTYFVLSIRFFIVAFGGVMMIRIMMEELLVHLCYALY
jgi:hypothetical protein